MNYANNMWSSPIHNKAFISNYNNIDFQGRFSIKSFFQDSLGNLFISTDKGLFSFDGTNWKRVKKTEGIEFEDFCILNNEILAVGDRDFGYIEKFSNNEFHFNSLEDSVLHLEENINHLSDIICGPENSFYLIYENGILIREDDQYKLLAKEKGRAIGALLDKKIILHQKGLGIYYIYNNTELIPYITSDEIRNIEVSEMIMKDEKLLIFSKDKGIFIYENKALVTHVQLDLIINDAKMVNEDILALATDKNGVILLDKSNFSILKIIDEKSGLKTNSIQTIWVDKQQNLWVGSSIGLQKVEIFIPFSYHIGANQIVGNITSLEYFKNKLLVSTSEGIYSLEDYDELRNIYDFQKRIDIKSSNCIIESIGDKLLVTDDEHLYYYDSLYTSRRLDLYKTGEIVSLSNGEFLIYSDQGIKHYRNCSQIECNIAPWFSDWVYDQPIESLVRFGNDSSFIVLEDNKLFYLNFGNKNGHLYLKSKDQINSSLKFLHLFQNSQYILVTSPNMMFALMPASNGIDFIECEFLSEEDIDFSLYQNLFFEETVNFSLLVLNSRANGTKAFYKLNEDFKFIPVTYFRRFPKGEIRALLLDKDEIGKYWLCNENGLISYFSYDLHNSASKNKSFKTIITQFPNSNSLENGIEIPYRENTIRFEYTSTNFIAENLNKYSYFLDGFSEEWSAWSTENKVTFANLPEGEYLFKVKSKNIYQNESSVTSFRFKISPPWYRSIWAYIFYTLITAFVIYILVDLNTARLKKANIRLQNIINERTEEIRRQKEEIEEKNKDITSSIEYARTIQDAILTSKEYLKSILKNYFVFYKPKDIIGGDFYWAYKTLSNKIILAVADCTGHGVPGALMSMIGNSLLNEIIIENQIYETNVILDQLRAGIINSFQSNSTLREERSHDGMDISIACIDPENMELEYSAAKHIIYVIRNNETIETYNDFQPVSNFVTHLEPYTKHVIKLQKNDTIYLCTDGFADQFGGEKGKKFMQKKFRELLKKISNEPMELQKELIEKSFNLWRGEHEQIDDVCILGFRVS